jgi:hypothetical protein
MQYRGVSILVFLFLSPFQISHAATATQVARFFYRMATGHLINVRALQRMLDYMADPGLTHKLFKSLRTTPIVDVVTSA